MAWIKLNNVYMVNSTSSSSSSTSISTYTYTTTTSSRSIACSTTYNTVLSSGTLTSEKNYKLCSIYGTSFWNYCSTYNVTASTAGNTITIGWRSMELSVQKNTWTNSNYETLSYGQYGTYTGEISYQSSTNDNDSMVTTWIKQGASTSKVDLVNNNVFTTGYYFNTISKTINNFFKENCKYRCMGQSFYFYNSYTITENSATSNGSSTVTLTVGNSDNSSTVSYADKQYLDTFSFTHSAYNECLMTINSEYYSDLYNIMINNNKSSIYRQNYTITRNLSYYRTLTSQTSSEETGRYTVTLTSTR